MVFATDQVRVLAQDRALRFLEPGSRLDAHLLGQRRRGQSTVTSQVNPDMPDMINVLLPVRLGLRPGTALPIRPEVLVATRLTLIVNPAAGGGRTVRRLAAVEAVLAGAGARYRTYRSSSLPDVGVLAAEAAARGDLPVAVGGDGTVGAVAVAVSATVAGGAGVFGVIPAGTGNDCARTYGIPSGPADAARLLLGGEPCTMDLIAVTGAGGTRVIVAGSVYFGIASAAGEIARKNRLIHGPLVYPAATLLALARWKPAVFTVAAIDGAEAGDPRKFRGYSVVVANVPYFGGGIKVAPTADPADGLLDVVLVGHAPKLAFLRLLGKARDGSHLGSGEVSTYQATGVEVTVDPPLPAGADGEPLQVEPPLRLRALPGAVNIMAPRNGPPTRSS